MKCRDICRLPKENGPSPFHYRKLLLLLDVTCSTTDALWNNGEGFVLCKFHFLFYFFFCSFSVIVGELRMNLNELQNSPYDVRKVFSFFVKLYFRTFTKRFQQSTKLNINGCSGNFIHYYMNYDSLSGWLSGFPVGEFELVNIFNSSTKKQKRMKHINYKFILFYIPETVEVFYKNCFYCFRFFLWRQFLYDRLNTGKFLNDFGSDCYTRLYSAYHTGSHFN